jgi:hypothetical protein
MRKEDVLSHYRIPKKIKTDTLAKRSKKHVTTPPSDTKPEFSEKKMDPIIPKEPPRNKKGEGKTLSSHFESPEPRANKKISLSASSSSITKTSTSTLISTTTSSSSFEFPPNNDNNKTRGVDKPTTITYFGDRNKKHSGPASNPVINKSKKSPAQDIFNLLTHGN